MLGGTLNVHLVRYSQDHPICVRELKDGTYVDDINIASETVEETRKIQENAVKILGEGGFQLHKWYSNAAELESDVKEDGETTYAKESLGTTPTETKRLGLRRLEEIRSHFVSDISTKRKLSYEKNRSENYGKNL